METVLTNIFKTPEKVALRDRLFEIGVETLKARGWEVIREPKIGKASVRRIRRGDENYLVSIRTTQDRYIAFPPKPNGKGWETLDEVDVVVAVSVDENLPPKEAFVHWLDGDEVRERFNRAAKARKGHYKERPGRGIWLPLYIPDDGSVVRFVGGGMGLDHPAIARVSIRKGDPVRATKESEIRAGGAIESKLAQSPEDEQPTRALTMAEAKRGLALTFGVPESSIRITIEA